MYKPYNMGGQHVVKALYRNDKFIRDLPCHSVYKKFFTGMILPMKKIMNCWPDISGLQFMIFRAACVEKKLETEQNKKIMNCTPLLHVMASCFPPLYDCMLYVMFCECYDMQCYAMLCDANANVNDVLCIAML